MNAAGFRHSPVLPDQPPPRNGFAPLRPTVQLRHPPSGPLRIIGPRARSFRVTRFAAETNRDLQGQQPNG